MNPSPPQLTIRISWFGMLNYLGALLTTGWLLYLIYGAAGAAYALLALLVLGAVLRFGASPLFALSASILYFRFDAAGLWLPLFSYAMAGVSFNNDLRRYRASQTSGQ
jgi:hypothetical protein